jgi:hypothetical protein
VFVHREVVKDHHVARPERGDEDLLDIRAERPGIDRATKTAVAVSAVGRSAATTVCVCQWLQGV